MFPVVHIDHFGITVRLENNRSVMKTLSILKTIEIKEIMQNLKSTLLKVVFDIVNYLERHKLFLAI